MPPAGAVQQGRRKLIEWFEGSIAGRGVDFELFDLESDISEQRNIAGTNPALARKLQSELASWGERVGAQMPSATAQRSAPLIEDVNQPTR